MDLEKIVQSNIDKHIQEEAQEGIVEEIQEVDNSLAVAQNSQPQAVVGFKDTIKSITQSYIPDRTKSINEQAKEAVDVFTVAEAVKDENTVANLTKHKKDELTSRAEAHAKEEQAKSKSSKVTLQKAEFGIYEGVASYAGIKKSLPRVLMLPLMIPLMVVVGILLFVIGTLTAIINIAIDSVNSIIIRFSELTENSKKAIKNIGIGTAVVVAVGLLYLGLKTILQYYGMWFKF